MGIPQFALAQWTAIDPIEAGTTLQIRTTQPVDTQTIDGRVFTGIVENDVFDAGGRLVIPRGAGAQILMKGRRVNVRATFDSMFETPDTCATGTTITPTIRTSGH